MDVKNQILDMIQKRESDLPALPQVLKNIIAMGSDPATTIDHLAEVISYDPTMSDQLIQLANSAYYAPKNPIEHIKRAILVIGFDETMGIALAMGILATAYAKTGLTLDTKALWLHSIGVATVSKELAKRTNPGIAGKIFIPALLHDMGKAFFSIYFKGPFLQAKQFAIENKKTLYFSENALLQLDHAVLSALIMKRWKFDQSIIMPCRFHHVPESCPVKFRHKALIINLADYLTQKAGIGHSGNPVPVTVKNAPMKVGVGESVLRLIIEKLKRKEPEIKEFFKITTSTI